MRSSFMQIIINATDAQYALLVEKCNKSGHSISQYKADSTEIAEADLLIDACFEEDGPAFLSVTELPVLVNAVITTSQQLPKNFVRFNGWNGFLGQPKLEIAGHANSVENYASILESAGIDYMVSVDEIGMIGARVVAMMINEAYFALSEGVSSKEDINTAMKLGTNYPYGPFEWADMIGVQKIAALLNALSKTDSRYEIAPALKLTSEWP